MIWVALKRRNKSTKRLSTYETLLEKDPENIEYQSHRKDVQQFRKLAEKPAQSKRQKKGTKRRSIFVKNSSKQTPKT